MNPIGVHTHEDKLLEFAYGELPDSEARLMEAHVKGCQRCAGTLESIQGVRGVMARLEPEPAPDAGLESLLAYAQQSARRANAGPVPQPAWWRRWLVPVTGMATLAVVGVIATQALKVTKAPALAPESSKMVAEAPMAPPAAPAPVARERQNNMEKANISPEQKAEAQQATTGAPVVPRGSGSAFSVDVESRRDAVANRQPPAPKGSGSSYGDATAPTAAPAPAPASAQVAAAGSAPAEEDRQEFMESAAKMQRAVPPVKSAPLANAMPQQALSGEDSGGRTEGLSMRGKKKSAYRSADKEAAPSDDLDDAKQEQAPAADARGLVAQADAAARAGDRAGQAQLLRQAVAANPSQSELQKLLSRLCDAELELGLETPGCERLMREFPRSGAAQVAQRRLVSAPAAAAKASSKAAAPGMPARQPAATPSKKADQRNSY